MVLGLKFIKVPPNEYIIQYKDGKIIREGMGLSFFYFSPTASLVSIPVGSVDVPFIFNEVTADFQEITIQGQVTYKVIDPIKLSGLMNFTLAADGKSYETDDAEKLPKRVINNTQVLTRSLIKSLPLKKALSGSDDIVASLHEKMNEMKPVTSLGVRILDFSILSIKPSPETSRALEAEAREEILLQADEAIYHRRNAAVEQERAIQENELNTEIAVENKKREIEETRMDAEKAVQIKKRELQEAEMAARISLEEKNRKLVELAAENLRIKSDSKAYGISAAMRAFSQTDPKIIQALATVNMQPDKLIALAFKELAEGSEKINNLNITPDMLHALLKGKEKDQS